MLSTINVFSITSAILWLFAAGFVVFSIIRMQQGARRAGRSLYAIDHYWSAIFSLLAAACFATLQAFLPEMTTKVATFDPTALAMLAITALASSAAVLVGTVDPDEVVRNVKSLFGSPTIQTNQKQA